MTIAALQNTILSRLFSTLILCSFIPTEARAQNTMAQNTMAQNTVAQNTRVQNTIPQDTIPQDTIPQDGPKTQTLKRVVEDLPQPLSVTPSFYKVPAHKTPSGFPVPRYVSLKVGKANGRIGPSINHPIAWQYRRRGLPLIVVAETERWRKVRDVNGDETWIYAPALSGERHAIALTDIPLRTRSKDTARIRAVALKGALVKIEDCRDNDWCRFKSADGLKGWAKQAAFWGVGALE